MRFEARLWPAALLALAVAAACIVADDREQEPWSDWRTLRMQVHAMPLLSGGLELERQLAGGRLRLETRTTARLMGATIARARSLSVLDPDTVQPSEQVSVSKERGRRFVFGADGYDVEKFRSPGGPDGEQAQWEKESSEHHAYPRANGKALPVYDYYGMLLRLSKEKLDAPGDEVTLHVATKKGPQAFQIRVADSRESDRTFVDARTREKQTRRVREFRLRVLPADPESDEGFLDMEGETELWVEARTKTPLEISGKVPRVPGRVTLALAELG